MYDIYSKGNSLQDGPRFRWEPPCIVQYNTYKICYVQYIGMRDGKHLFVRNESLFTSEPWLCVTTAHELRRIWKLGGKGRGFYTWAWCVSNRSWALGNKYVAVTQCWRGPTSIRILHHIFSHPGLFFLSTYVSQCKITCSHARYVLLNLRILLVKTPLQPASSQNAARNTLRASGFCLVQISDLNRAPPPELMFSAASEVDMRQPIRSCLHWWV